MGKLERARQSVLQRLDIADRAGPQNEKSEVEKRILIKELESISSQLTATKAKLSEYEIALLRMESRLRQLERQSLASESMMTDEEFLSLRKDTFEADQALGLDLNVDSVADLLSENVDEQLQAFREREGKRREEAGLAVQREQEEASRRSIIRIDVLPASANLFVSGDRASVTGSAGLRTVTIDRPSGSYRVKVTCDGFEPFESDLSVEEGKTVALQIRLQSLALAKKESTAVPPGTLSPSVTPAETPLWNRVVDVAELNVDDEFKPLLHEGSPILKTSGARVVQLRDGRMALISIAASVPADDTPDAQLAAEKVCQIKAIANLVAMKNGISVVREETLTVEAVTSEHSQQVETTNVTQMVEKISAQVRGKEKSLPIVGRWYTDEGKVLHLAIGEIISPDREKND